MTTKAPVKEREATKVGPPVAKKSRKPIRWIGYAAVIAVVAAASIVAFITLGGEDEALPFDVEAASPVIIGERHLTTDFEVAPRYVGESGMTLAEFEAAFDGFRTLYEAESLLVTGARHGSGFTVAPRYVGESGMTLAEFEAAFDTFDMLYEAGSPALIGERHAGDFEVALRYVGESGMTLEEFEASQ